MQIYDVDGYGKDFQQSFQQMLLTDRPDLHQKTEMLPLMSKTLSEYSQTENEWIGDILQKAKQRARGKRSRIITGRNASKRYRNPSFTKIETILTGVEKLAG